MKLEQQMWSFSVSLVTMDGDGEGQPFPFHCSLFYIGALKANILSKKTLKIKGMLFL